MRKSPIVIHPILIAGHRTSISVEDAFWEGPQADRPRSRHDVFKVRGAIRWSGAQLTEPRAHSAILIGRDSSSSLFSALLPRFGLRTLGRHYLQLERFGDARQKNC